MQVVRTLELYCGCGGLSFADRHTKEVIIETKWAVDYERSMTDTFQANYPYAHVSAGLLCSALLLCSSAPMHCLSSTGAMHVPCMAGCTC